MLIKNEIYVGLRKLNDKNMQVKFLKISVAIVFLCGVILVACKNGSGNSTEKTATVQAEATATTAKGEKSGDKMLIGDIPFAFELLDQLYQNNLPFNITSMNKAENISKYNRALSRSLNLGVYGSDLAYAITYEQFQLIASYTKNCKKMTEDLNLNVAFDEMVLQRFNEYKDNKDSLSKLVYNSFSKIDKTLKSEERLEAAIMVLAGSWVESIYIATTANSSTVTATKEIINKSIANQKQSLQTLLALIDEFKRNEYIEPIYNGLIDIQKEFSLQNDDTLLSEKQLKLISDKVALLRKKIVENKL